MNLDNDIALIRLAGEVVYTDYISPACLPGENEDVAVNTSCWITGWGDTQDCKSKITAASAWSGK